MGRCHAAVVTQDEIAPKGQLTLTAFHAIQRIASFAVDDPSVRGLNGPSINGTALQNGESHKIGPGGVVVIPPQALGIGLAQWMEPSDTWLSAWM